MMLNIDFMQLLYLITRQKKRCKIVQNKIFALTGFHGLKIKKILFFPFSLSFLIRNNT